jgi:hypothetical protein
MGFARAAQTFNIWKAAFQLAAKPIIDIDVVVPTYAELPETIERLASLGYVHRGNLGIEDREAFASPPQLQLHHLYACVQGSNRFPAGDTAAGGIPRRSPRTIRDANQKQGLSE